MTNVDTQSIDTLAAAALPLTPPVRVTVFVSRWPDIPAIEMPIFPNGTFSPTTAILVSGATEVVLIDALYLKDDVRDLGDLIERTGKKLTTIYITHAHQDHYLGFPELLARFPEAKCVALPHVIEAMQQTMELQSMHWLMMFGDTCLKAGPLPEPLEGHTLYVDGSPLNIIEVKQADIHPTTIVHVPEIDVVIAGDSIYNEMHPMLALSTPEEWADWLETIDLVEGLRPKMIVAGHRRPDGDDYAVDTMISQTRAYLLDYQAAYEVASDADELVDIMSAKYPFHGNLWTLQFSAMNSMQYRLTGNTVAHSAS